jgi:hypothetical protein
MYNIVYSRNKFYEKKVTEEEREDESEEEEILDFDGLEGLIKKCF